MPVRPEELADYIARYKEKRKKEVISFLGGICAICGTSDNLEIDHIDPSTKEFTLAKNWTRAKSATFAEAEKCQLLCVSCHIKKTKLEQTISECGTTAKYLAGCKCKECKESWSKYQKEYRKKRKNSVSNI